MALEYNREVIGEKINLTTLKDEKFKTNMINIYFKTKLSEDTVSVYSIIPELLKSTNSKFPDRTEFSKKLYSLYGATVNGWSTKISDSQIVVLSASTIRDEYALEGEKLTKEISEIFLNCVFSPAVENNGFLKEEFAVKKQELLDTIDSLINEKRSYAIKKAYEKIFENEPFATNTYGSREKAEELTPEYAYECYKNLLKTSEIEIFVCGGGDLTDAVNLVKESFSKIEREPEKLAEFKAFSPVKSEVARVCEPMEVNQSKMVMAYKSDYEDIYVCKFMIAMLGGTAFSKLFTNVREKLSLCYYCASRYVDGKGTMIIDSGVDTKNIHLAQEAINEQLEDMAKGNFSDELMENTRLSILGDLKSTSDTISGLCGWYLNQRIRGTDYSLGEVEKIEKSITREKIIECAKTFKLDTVYILESKQGGEN